MFKLNSESELQNRATPLIEKSYYLNPNVHRNILFKDIHIYSYIQHPFLVKEKKIIVSSKCF